MSKKNKEIYAELSYEVSKGEIIRTALRRFYKNKIVALIGPCIVLLGFILINGVRSGLGAFILNFGILITATPYIIILMNFKSIRDSSVKFVITEENMTIQEGKYKSLLNYSEIESVESDEFYIKIKTNSENKDYRRTIMIPINNITKGNYNKFLEVLKVKIDKSILKKEL